MKATVKRCGKIIGRGHNRRVQKIGENTTFKGPESYSRRRGVKLINLNLPECKEMMKSFTAGKPKLWNEDIGVCRGRRQVDRQQ